MFLELEFEELENAFDLELEQVTEISDGGYDRGYGDAMKETEAEATIQDELLSQVADALGNKVSGYERGKNEGFADALDKRTDLVVTANGDYTPREDSTGFKSVSVNVKSVGKLPQVTDGSATEITGDDLYGCTKVNTYALSYCYDLKKITFPDTINTFAGWSCIYLKALETIVMRATTPPRIDSTSFKGSTDVLKEIIVPIGSAILYKNATNWSALADKIIEGDV